MPDLFTPIRIGDYELPNRIVMAPLTRSRSIGEGVPNVALKSEYYSQRASAGLIIAEATAVSSMGIGWLNTCGIYSDEQQEAWSRITKAVHGNDGHIFVQLWHMGATVSPDFIDGNQPVSASEVKLEGEVRTPKGRKQNFVTPHSLTRFEIKAVQKEYIDSIKRSISAGFDGVEIHAANGFLIDQFTRDGTNKRVDMYGGSIDNRIRFCLEIVEQACESVGSNKVGIWLSPTNKVWGIKDSNHRETFGRLITKLNDYGLAYLHILEPKPDSRHVVETIDFMTPHVRDIYNGTLIVNGGYTKDTGTDAIIKGLGDAVAYGTLFIANPDLVNRFKFNAELATPDKGTYYTNEANGYTDYPTMDELLRKAS